MRTAVLAIAIALAPLSALAESESHGPEPYIPNMAEEAFAALDRAEKERGQIEAVDIPPGHYPPPGHCRVWDPDLPAGHQPPPYRC